MILARALARDSANPPSRQIFSREHLYLEITSLCNTVQSKLATLEEISRVSPIGRTG